VLDVIGSSCSGNWLPSSRFVAPGSISCVEYYRACEIQLQLDQHTEQHMTTLFAKAIGTPPAQYRHESMKWLTPRFIAANRRVLV
jgi:hypothetical protein